MKKSRRVLALVLTALMMVGCFAACGDQAGDTEANTLVIGGIGPLTGGARVLWAGRDEGRAACRG